MAWVSASFLIIPAAGAEIFDNVKETRLDNGLNVILMENHISPVVSLQIWFVWCNMPPAKIKFFKAHVNFANAANNETL
ncbi:MAG: hypothetical protein VR65_00910 [Desulfobulbaceae bacterium BRH_c16a]|nr:MAG: hypothetical protein VR65_00910 [Desulfobulbaceae bacterium BRH_c16a]